MSSEIPSAELHQSFVRALTRHERVIRAYVRGTGIYRPEDIDEILQEVSLVAWAKFDQLEKVEDFPRWACVIARYQVLIFRRKHARDRLVFDDRVFELLADTSSEDLSLKERRLAHLQSCLAKLPEASRRLVLAAYEPGSSIDRVAERMGRKANTLYQQLWRLRRVLEDCVENAISRDSELRPSDL